MVNINHLDHYKQWIEKIECRYPQKMWVATMLPAATLQAKSFKRLGEMIAEHCTDEVIELAAEALKFRPEGLRTKMRGFDITDSRQAVCIVVKYKFPGVNHSFLAKKLGWGNHSMVTHAMSQADVLEIKKRVHRILSRYPFLKDYETPIN